jgi:hypothetical protein
MASINLRSYQQILSSMVAKMKAVTGLTDLYKGSVNLTMLEAAASSDFSIEGKLLRLLQAKNIDKAKGQDLKDIAIEFGVTPAYVGAAPASVLLTIGDSAFTKKSSTIYAGTANPVSGNTTLNIVDGTGFGASGTIYVGRNTSAYEALSYTSIVNSGGGYWVITLAAPLAKDHLVGEEVVYAQGGDRPIAANTIARVPAASGAPALEFRILNNYTLLDGEDTLKNVAAVSTDVGLQTNVPSARVSEFTSPPWTTATVTNPDAARGGVDAETDDQLRQRIKDWVHNLSRGTAKAITRAVVGSSDPDESKRVVSAFFSEPAAAGEYGILYIDDGSVTGFQPSFSGTGEETVVDGASGTEQHLQLQQWPLVKGEIASVNTEPFLISGGEVLAVETDGVTEQKTFTAAQFQIPGQATAQELAQAINSLFTIVEARAKDGVLYVSPVADDPDYVKINAATSGVDANTYIKFPTTKSYVLRLYKNDRLLSKNGLTATITSKPSSEWPAFSSSETLQLKVDGISGPTVTLTDADFALLTSSANIKSASPNDWEIMINAKFAGVTAEAQADGTFTVTSNRGKKATAQVSILGGSLAGTLFASGVASTGLEPEYTLNRLAGTVRLAAKLAEGDVLKAGDSNTRGFVDSAAQASFAMPLVNSVATTGDTTNGSDQLTNLGSTAGIVKGMSISGAGIPAETVVASISGSTVTMSKNATATAAGVAVSFGWTSELVLVSGSSATLISLAQTGTLTFTNGTANLQKVQSSVSGYFASLKEGDWVHLFNCARHALLKVYRVYQTTNPNDSIDLFDPEAAAGATALDGLTNLISAFRSDGKPQLVRLPFGSAVSNSDIASYINAQAESVSATVLSTGAVRIQTTRFQAGGAMAIPAVSFNAKNTFGVTADSYESNDPQVAALESDDLAGLPAGQALPGSSDIVVPYDAFSASGTPFADYTYANRLVLGYFGSSSLSLRIPLLRGSTSSLTLRNLVPEPWTPLGGEDRFVTTDGVDLGEADNMVFLLDNNASQKTFDVPMYVKGTVAAPAAPTTSQFDVADESSTNLGTSSRWSGFSFNDYRVWFRARRDVPSTPANTDVRIRAVKYGPNGQKIRFGFFYPTLPDQSALATLTVNTANDTLDLATFLDSGAAVAIGLATGQRVYVDVSGSGPYTYKFQFVSPVDLSGVSAGQIVSAVDSVAAANRYPMKIASTSNLRDASKSFEHTAEALTATVSGATGSSATVQFTTTPAQALTIGDRITIGGNTATVTTVNAPDEAVVGANSFSNGAGQAATLTHVKLSISSAPSFTIAVGDVIQVGSNFLRITGVDSQTLVSVDSTFTFTGAQAGTVSRIYVTATRYVNGTSQNGVGGVTIASPTSFQIYSVGTQTATQLIAVINGTADAAALVTALNSSGSTGAGTITASTEDELADGNLYVALQNGEGFVRTTNASSPGLTLKSAVDATPEIGESVILLPCTPQNIADHFQKKQITGLSIAADVAVVDRGRRVQVSTKTVGGSGQVYAVGGKANGNSAFTVRNNCQVLSSSRGQVEMDASALTQVSPGQTIKLSQTSRARKDWTGSAPTAADTVALAVAAGVVTLTSSWALVTNYAFSQSSNTEWMVRRLSRNRFRYELYSGTSAVPATLKVNDWVFIGNGSASYAGTTPAAFFLPGNSGWFQIRDTDNSTYFDVDNAGGVEELVTCTSAPFIFTSYHSARPGDQISLGVNTPLAAANQGTFTITDVPSTTSIKFANTAATAQVAIALGAAGAADVRVLDQGYITYRKVVLVSPKPGEAASRALVIVTPGTDLGLLSEGQGAIAYLQNRLGYSVAPVNGLNGYQYWIGLKRRAQRIIDGFLSDITNFPGYKASGSFVEAKEPQIQRIVLGLQIKTKDGVALTTIADDIKSRVIGYINGLGLGDDVIVASIISAALSAPGVESVTLVTPEDAGDRISVGDKALAKTSAAEITLS